MGSSDVLKWHPVDGWYVADVILTSSLMVVMYSSRRPQIPLQTINVSGAIKNIANNKKNIRVVADRKNILEDPVVKDLLNNSVLVSWELYHH